MQIPRKLSDCSDLLGLDQLIVSRMTPDPELNQAKPNPHPIQRLALCIEGQLSLTNTGQLF